MIRRPPRSTLSSSSAASDVYKRQGLDRSSTTTKAITAAQHSRASSPKGFNAASQGKQLLSKKGVGVQNKSKETTFWKLRLHNAFRLDAINGASTTKGMKQRTSHRLQHHGNNNFPHPLPLDGIAKKTSPFCAKSCTSHCLFSQQNRLKKEEEKWESKTRQREEV